MDYVRKIRKQALVEITFYLMMWALFWATGMSWWFSLLCAIIVIEMQRFTFLAITKHSLKGNK